MSDKNRKRKILLRYFILAIISFAASFFIAYFAVSFFKNDFQFAFSVDLFTDSAVWIATALIAAVFIAVLVFIFIKSSLTNYNGLLSKNTKLDSKLYGSSEFQTQKEIDENYKKISWGAVPSETNAQGFIVMSRKDKGDFVINRAKASHTLILATTRTGKTTLFISPNIQYLSRCPNKPSFFIADPKGELFQNNSKHLLEQGYNIFVLNLREPTKSNKYNPLGIIWDFYQLWLKTSDSKYLDLVESLLRDIATTISPEANGKDSTWAIGAQNIIQGLLLAMLEDSEDAKFNMTKDKFTLWQVLNLLTQDQESLQDFAVRRKKGSLAMIRLSQYFSSGNAANETKGSFIIETTNKLNTYVDTGMTYLMSDTELNLNEIADKPYAIFCIVPDDNKSRHPLAALFISQIYKYLIFLADEQSKESGVQALPNEFYFILEEFGNFPKMECIEQMLSIGGGRKIWTSIVLQSLSQIRHIYGKELSDTILNNIQLQIYMGSTDNETNKYYSEFFGSKTVTKLNIQLSSTDIMKDISGSSNAEKAVLIHPDELSRLEFGDIVFKMFRHQPVRSKLAASFDPELIEKKIWVQGACPINWKKIVFDKVKLYYDLKERDNAFDNIFIGNGLQEEIASTKDADDVTAARVENSFASEAAIVPTQENKKASFDYLDYLKKKI